MIAIPAIDLRKGACVQLVGGDFANEQIRITDPVAVAVKWRALGFRHLHIVDLDAATGNGSNAVIIDEILATVDAEVQVGGGVRSIRRIEELTTHGARRVVVGTRALQDAEWLRSAAMRFPDQIIVAADARGRRVCVNGWGDTLDRDVVDVAREMENLPLASLLVTAIDVEGRMQGPALGLTRQVISATRMSIVASGGIADVADLRDLERIGAAAAVIGMALYTNSIDAAEAAREFAA